jgi:hypothetical protein
VIDALAFGLLRRHVSYGLDDASFARRRDGDRLAGHVLGLRLQLCQAEVEHQGLDAIGGLAGKMVLFPTSRRCERRSMRGSTLERRTEF